MIITAIISLVFDYQEEFKKRSKLEKMRDEKIVEYSLLIQPNFNSGKLLYEKINYYKGLIKSRNTLSISRTLQLKEEDAKLIKSIEIIPFFDKKDIIVKYDNFLSSLYLVNEKSIPIERFERMFNHSEYRRHKIVIVGRKKIILKLVNRIFDSFSESVYVNQQKKIELNFLDRMYNFLTKKLNESKKISIKDIQGVKGLKSIIDIKKVEDTKSVRETYLKELLKFERRIIFNLKDLDKQKIEKQNTITIISGSFNEIFYKEKEDNKDNKDIKYDRALSLALLAGGIVLSFYGLKSLNNYLKNYRE